MSPQARLKRRSPDESRASARGTRRTAERHLAPEAVVFFSFLERYKAVLRTTASGKRSLLTTLTARKLPGLSSGKVVVADGLEADLAPFRQLVDRTMRSMAARNSLISSDPAIMGGTPVIAGTRITVYSVLGRLEYGDSIEAILNENPDLTRDAVEAAAIYAKTHPRVGRPGGRPFKTVAAN